MNEHTRTQDSLTLGYAHQDPQWLANNPKTAIRRSFHRPFASHWGVLAYRICFAKRIRHQLTRLLGLVCRFRQNRFRSLGRSRRAHPRRTLPVAGPRLPRDRDLGVGSLSILFNPWLLTPLQKVVFTFWGFSGKPNLISTKKLKSKDTTQ